MLGNGKGVRAERLAIPAGDAGETVRDILDCDVGGFGIEQVESAPGEHPLPGARRCC